MRRAQMGREDLGEYSVVHDDSWWRLGQCSHAWWHSSCRGHNYSRLGERKILTNTARSVAHDDSWRLGERNHAWWHSSCTGLRRREKILAITAKSVVWCTRVGGDLGNAITYGGIVHAQGSDGERRSWRIQCGAR